MDIHFSLSRNNIIWDESQVKLSLNFHLAGSNQQNLFQKITAEG